jgi:5-methylcytosine-specific restriction endonuclease McrBC GTP-binding regulatory subunit McrB
MRQTRVTSSLDTTSILSVTVLASARNFRLYQESSTRTSATRTDNEPTKYNNKDKSLRKVIPEEYHDFLAQSGNPAIEVQG